MRVHNGGHWRCDIALQTPSAVSVSPKSRFRADEWRVAAGETPAGNYLEAPSQRRGGVGTDLDGQGYCDMVDDTFLELMPTTPVFLCP